MMASRERRFLQQGLSQGFCRHTEKQWTVKRRKRKQKTMPAMKKRLIGLRRRDTKFFTLRVEVNPRWLNDYSRLKHDSEN